MTKILLIADDLTGALDAGVCLLPAEVLVATSFERVDRGLLDACPEALCVNASSRHVGPEEAARRVGRLVRLAREAGVPCVVKKTDSALRGNVGAELAAALEASGRERLHFIPALPEMGRVTRGGVHYVDGVPVEESSFGHDPFEPVTRSDVRGLIARQTSVPVTLVAEGEPVALDAQGIVAYDATTPDSMLSRVAALAAAGELGVVAGCSGIAHALSAVLGLRPSAGAAPVEEGNLLVVCGSVNRASREQCAYAEGAGARVEHIGETEKCDASWADGPEGRAFVRRVSESWAGCPLTVVDGSGLEDLSARVAPGLDVRQVVADNIGGLLVRVCARGVFGRVLVTGGDVLASFLSLAGAGSVRPLVQARPGIVGFELEVGGSRLVIYSKSGGFGSRELLVDMARASQVCAKECIAHA